VWPTATHQKVMDYQQEVEFGNRAGTTAPPR
jgi:hypothetical protein